MDINTLIQYKSCNNPFKKKSISISAAEIILDITVETLQNMYEKNVSYLTYKNLPWNKLFSIKFDLGPT